MAGIGDTHFTEGTINKLRLRNISSGVTFELEGDWVRASKLMKDLPNDLRKALFAGQRVFANAYKDNLINNIQNNGGNIRWAPLKAKYKKQKAKKAAYPENIGMYRGFMAQGIKIYFKGNSVISIGISRTTKIKGVGEGNELTLAQYANIFEHGSYSRNIEARPLFGPTYRQMGGNKGLTAIVLGSISAVMLAKHKIKV